MVVKKILPILIVIFFALLGVWALLPSGLPPTHDGEYHVIRFYEFDKTLRESVGYPRWAPDLNNGYGVPLFNYVYSLPNVIAFILHFFGSSFIDAFKLQMFMAGIIGSIFFFLWSKRFWGVTGGIVSSIYYTFAPYHFVDIYIRGSVGEVWALALFPAFLWAFSIGISEQKKHFSFLASIFLSLIIFSHNILALMFFSFVIGYTFFILSFIKDKKKTFQEITAIFICGLGISAIFWLPALFENGYVTGLQIYKIQENFPELYQLLIPSWGSGFSQLDLQNQMSYQIGLAHILVIPIGFVVMLILLKRNKYIAQVLLFFLLCFFVIFFLMLKSSLFIWENVPLLNYFQFPWRLLSLEILITSFLAGSIFVLFNKTKKIKTAIKYSLAVFLIAIELALCIGYAKPAFYHLRSDNYYITRSNFIDGTNSPGNLFNTIWMVKDLKKQYNRINISKESGEVLTQEIKATQQNFTVKLKNSTQIVVNTAYFPGWAVFIDGKRTSILKTKQGLISVNIPHGVHKIHVILEKTFIQAISEVISFVFVLILTYFYLKFFYVKIKQ